ncbi:aminoacyl-tRNA deacylase [Thiohalocapsa marina]|nr:YbaK/EbsC family protein [Thiohalocapsa marina]
MTIAARVEDYLKQHSVPFELLPHKTTGSTHETAEAAHVSDDHIAKAVMVGDEQGEAMVVIPGDSWLMLDRLNKASGRTFRLDEESELSRLFPDCDPGAVPPVGKAYGVETYLDEALTTLADVYFESGDHRNLVHINGPDFVRLLHGVRLGHFGRPG